MTRIYLGKGICQIRYKKSDSLIGSSIYIFLNHIRVIRKIRDIRD